jgi:hypothetical protein
MPPKRGIHAPFGCTLGCKVDLRPIEEFVHMHVFHEDQAELQERLMIDVSRINNIMNQTQEYISKSSRVNEKDCKYFNNFTEQLNYYENLLRLFKSGSYRDG